MSSNSKSRLKNIATASVVALSLTVVSGCYSSRAQSRYVQYVSPSEAVSSDTVVCNPNNFDNLDLILDKHDKINIRKDNEPVYDTLLFDETHNYYCYIYPKTPVGLQRAFKKTNHVLRDNNTNFLHPNSDDVVLPPFPFPQKLPSEGNIYTNYESNYYIPSYPRLNEALTIGKARIDKMWYINNHSRPSHAHIGDAAR